MRIITRLILCLAAALLFAASAHATPVTVGSTEIKNWRYGDGQAFLYVYANSGFTPAGGAGYVMPSKLGSGRWNQKVTCSASGGVLTIPSFEVESTTDSGDNNKATYVFVLADSRGKETDTFAANFFVPPTPNPTTWDILRTQNAAKPGPLPGAYWTSTQTVEYFNQQVRLGLPATTSTPGTVKLSATPADPAAPVAVGANDPRVPTQAENDALAGTAGSPSSSNKFVTDADKRVNTVFNVMAPPYNATGDGSTDDTAAIQAAITAAAAVKGTVLFPTPSVAYKITSTLTVTAPIQIRGEGSHNRNNFTFNGSGNFTVDYNAVPTGNCIRWAGGASGMMNVTNVINLAMENLCLDGANLATYGVKFDRLNQSSVRDISVLRVTGGSNAVAVLLGSTQPLHNGSAKNVFTNVYLQGDSALYLGSFDGGTSGAFVNIFHNLYAEHTGSDNAVNYGIYLQSGDNNHFHNTLSMNHADPTKDRDVWFSASGTYGSTWHANKAYNNYFWGLTATKIYTESDSPHTGKVVMDAANTATVLALASGAELDFEVSGLSANPANKVFRYYGTGEFLRGLVNRGGSSNALQTITGATTLSLTSGPRVNVSGTFPLIIPASSTLPGYESCLTNTGGGTVTLQRTGSDTFSGRGAASATSYSLTTQTSVCLIADGASAWILF